MPSDINYADRVYSRKFLTDSLLPSGLRWQAVMCCCGWFVSANSSGGNKAQTSTLCAVLGSMGTSPHSEQWFKQIWFVLFEKVHLFVMNSISMSRWLKNKTYDVLFSVVPRTQGISCFLLWRYVANSSPQISFHTVPSDRKSLHWHFELPLPLCSNIFQQKWNAEPNYQLWNYLPHCGNLLPLGNKSKSNKWSCSFSGTSNLREPQTEICQMYFLEVRIKDQWTDRGCQFSCTLAEYSWSILMSLPFVCWDHGVA